MKQTTNENIKQMDISLGGGLISEKIRIDTINHPILVIGLGGTGIDALLRLKYQVNRRFKLPDNPMTKKKKQKPDNIEYLAFETNEHDKKKYKGIGLDPNNELVLLSNASIGSILNNRSTIPEYISSWLSPELTITDGTKGASGNRQAGRLLLFEKINAVIESIDNKIRALRIDQENKLLVFILTGLSGGTGGGSFLDIAYIIRGLIERDYGNKGVDKVEISGYLFTPDVNLANNSLNVHTEEYIQRNGYASLKELDYWMNVEERGAGERFVQKYGTRLEVNSGMAPFNLCHLVSATNIDGIFLKGAYDYCMNVTAENIVNFVAQEDKESEQEFAIQDYQSNLISNIASMKSNLPMGMNHCANFIYNIIGASAAVLPTEEITTYLAYCLFKEIKDIFEQTPDEQGLSEFIATVKLDVDEVGNTLTHMIPGIRLDYEETDYFSYGNVIKTRRVNVDDKLNEMYQAAKRACTEARRTLPQQIIRDVKAELREVFLDPKRGPIYASRLLSGDRGPCLIRRIESYQQSIREAIARISEDLHGLGIECENRFEEARKSLFIANEKKKNAFIEAKVNEYKAKLKKDCFEQLLEIYKDLRNELENENDRIYFTYVEILNEINKILEKNGEIIVQGTEELTGNIKTYYWNIINVPDVAFEIDGLMKEAGTEPLIKDFARVLVEESNKWINESDLDIVGSLSDFIYDKFGALISKSMEEYLQLRYGKDRIIEQVIEQDIAPRLYKDAKPVFHLDNSAGMFNFPSYGIVSVPNNVPNILRGIEAYQRNSLSTLKFNIKRSKITNRIFWLNTQNGIPLFAYAPIRVYEELYERTIGSKEGVGRHLVMTERENWVNLPSPIPERIWGDTYTNPRQKAYNDRVGRIFDKALEYGSVRERPVENKAASRFECVISEDFDTEKYTFDDETDAATLAKMLSELNRMKENGFPATERKTIFNSENREKALVNFIRSPKLLDIVAAENTKFEKLNGVIEKIAALKAEKDRERSFADDFLRALMGEAIVKKGAQYIYNKELEEDPWEPLVNLIDHAEYPEFVMFGNFKALPNAKKEQLKRKSKANEDAFPDGKLLENLIKLQETYAARKDKIDSDQWNHDNGEEMYKFYRNMLLKLNTHISAIKD
ncbi:MAG: tubulin-like doman-containing protein [Clostridiales bacterium]|jgi:hypothetical protein|nr:tubulin-like doman-containing protein [Clostridiales bacterium]